MGARLSMAVIGIHVFCLLLVILVVAPRTRFLWAAYVLIALLLLSLGQYTSTRYTLDDTYLRAWTILGSRRRQLEDVRAIEFARLRDLSPTGGLLASWVIRGRMYSPMIGEFELVHTDASSGLLVTAGAYPLYISPRRPEEFARELSRRVRSYTGPLAKDVGYPGATTPTPSVDSYLG